MPAYVFLWFGSGTEADPTGKLRHALNEGGGIFQYNVDV